MNIVDLTKYIIEHYPYPKELSKARLNKIIYLVDWKFVLEYEKQLTSINWKFNHYGPYVDEIKDAIQSDNRFSITSTTTIYGNPKDIIELVDNKNFVEPNFDEKNIIDFIIDKTKKLYWNEFIELVYSTYPIISQEKGTNLDLVKLAKEYKEIIKNYKK
ncbi:Panacea domain-containing protein [Campylobacter sp. JMF_06 NA1]|uniref:Panacea domain-containing protein n=1 Tax=Campylobacter sp. JMF_06 NA1 TaxID=2983823 RepID=UPI0022E9DAF2|nr:Panacea domain-containing protein [Campylobacter sp. JMF_06 NA1]MDA3078131.1 Panacea domain-containing protein [Campylobacter sp. JMF_06 NA1]